MKVVLSERATLDLTNIGDFIALDSRSRSLTFIQELRAACLALRNNAMRYAHLEGYEHKGYRRRPLGNYLIIYTVGEQAVTVVRVLHAAQNLARLLENGPEN